MRQSKALAAIVVGLASSLLATQQASAACTRLAFSVNDYGKEGPIRDARNLLDKYIAKWTADRKITGYNVGPKEVTCELFLDVIVFDEYTCKAAATVCWNGPLPPGHQVDAEAQAQMLNKAAQSRPAGKAPPTAGAAPGSATPISTGSVRAAPKAPAAPAAGAAAGGATPAAGTAAAVPKAPAAAAPPQPKSPAGPAAAPGAPPAN